MLRIGILVATLLWLVLAMDNNNHNNHNHTASCRFLCPNRFGYFVMCCDLFPVRENEKLKCPPRPRDDYMDCTGVKVYVTECSTHSECEPEGKQCCRDVCDPGVKICMPGRNNFHYLNPNFPPSRT
ncbi:uncharacterized protein LOC143036075 [Oratosquilla oratoria]|uniref:uncharacterized protein LOC143036075 n=1 Tax=Oratosquilla oratoria TaxID=337810 RepID=UPI003F760E5A